jgi:hypothetical protein
MKLKDTITIIRKDDQGRIIFIGGKFRAGDLKIKNKLFNKK